MSDNRELRMLRRAATIKTWEAMQLLLGKVMEPASVSCKVPVDYAREWQLKAGMHEEMPKILFYSWGEIIYIDRTLTIGGEHGILHRVEEEYQKLVAHDQKPHEKKNQDPRYLTSREIAARELGTLSKGQAGIILLSVDMMTDIRALRRNHLWDIAGELDRKYSVQLNEMRLVPYLGTHERDMVQLPEINSNNGDTVPDMLVAALYSR